MKKFICFLLCFLMVIGILPALPQPTAAATTPKLVAITFDDGPGAYTNRLLDGLKARGAKATFFMVGSMMSSKMSTVRRMVQEGHQIGNHTWSHPDLKTLSYDGVNTELTRTRSLLQQAGGNRTYALRPPYGNYNGNVRTLAQGPVILWSVDTLDWQSRNANTVYNKIINQTTDGSIVLLHDIYSTSVDAALRAIDTLQARGYECVTVEELFRRRAVPLENGKVYFSAYNKGITLPAVEPPAAPTYQTTNVFGGKKVTLKCATADSVIYYTLNGSQPNDKSKKYTGAFTVNASSRLRAVAYNAGGAGKELNVEIKLATSEAPAITYEAGVATLKPAAGTLVYYTTDKTTPTDQSKKYTAPLTVGKRLNVRVSSSGKADRLINYTFTKYGAILTDTPAEAWYFKAVGEALHRGIMVGTDKTTFAPDVTMTRAMFVTALYRISPEFGGDFAPTTFTDVPKKAWYAEAVAWAQSKGIVAGMSENSYQPNGQITREQMCAILNRYLTVYGYKFDSVREITFTDDASISRWAKADVYALYEIGLISGMGHDTFEPLQQATRAQCAQLLVTLDQKTEQMNEEND
ncbi:MAG: polysaccharide deacetylase family protein [Clostridia bacterium]|nr:polysaccharide deacetylase family protein [Clostridia bacterium]